MARTTPAYRLHKPRNSVVVTLTDAVTKRRRDFYLGPFNSPKIRERYHRIVGEWEAIGRRLPRDHDTHTGLNGVVTVTILMRNFWRSALIKYRDLTGEPTTMLNKVKIGLRVLRALYGRKPADQFGPLALQEV